MNGQRALSVVAGVLAVLAIVEPVAAGVAATAAGAPSAGLGAAGVHVSTGVGDSMEPTIPAGGSAVCVEYVEPAVGDVVVVDLWGDGHLEVRHRVVQLNESHVRTSGDNLAHDDPAVPRERIRCTVVYAEGAGWRP